MEWTASKPTPSSPAHLLWDWADAAAPGSSGEAAGRRGKEKRAKVVVGEEGSGGGGGGGNARCQVEGCGVELRAAKEYHRKHRVCEAHTKSPRVVVAGQERRFCQQCSRWVFPDVPSLFAGVVFVHSVWLLAGAALFSSFRLLSIQRFHPLTEFDLKKRSCRRRLSDHNARRRKQQPDAFSFAPARLPSSLIFDDRRQISFVWDKAPLSHVRPFAISPWNSPSDFKLPQVKEIRDVSINGQVHLDKSRLPHAVPTLSHDIDGLLSMKGPDSSLSASKLGGAPDLQRALSLLSASSCGLPDPVLQASCLVQFTGASQNSRALPPSHGGSSASASFVEGHQPMAPSSQLVRFTLDGSSNGYESTFFGLNQMN